MRRRTLEASVLLAGLGAGGLLVIASGVVPIKASSGHWAVTEWFLSFTMSRSLATHSQLVEEPPDLGNAALILKGAGHFETSCRSCHGAPDLPQSKVAVRMLPRPPELAKDAPERTAKELFYVVKHGVKFTGMPAWTADDRDDEVWAMVAFLRKLPALDENGYRRLVRGDPERIGASLQIPTAVTQTCARCHGSQGQGRGDGAFPPLAGQPVEYLAAAMNAYASGARHSGMMEPVAAALSTASIRELSVYYAALPPSAARRSRDAAAIERGGELARRGVRDRGVPACLSCHGLETKDTRGEFPALAGLPAGYLELQLELFREGRRGGSPYAHLMTAIAGRLRPEEIRDAAAYYESLRRSASKPNTSAIAPRAAGSR